MILTRAKEVWDKEGKWQGRPGALIHPSASPPSFLNYLPQPTDSSVLPL